MADLMVRDGQWLLSGGQPLLTPGLCCCGNTDCIGQQCSECFDLGSVTPKYYSVDFVAVRLFMDCYTARPNTLGQTPSVIITKSQNGFFETNYCLCQDRNSANDFCTFSYVQDETNPPDMCGDGNPAIKALGWSGAGCDSAMFPNPTSSSTLDVTLNYTFVGQQKFGCLTAGLGSGGSLRRVILFSSYFPLFNCYFKEPIKVFNQAIGPADVQELSACTYDAVSNSPDTFVLGTGGFALIKACCP